MQLLRCFFRFSNNINNYATADNANQSFSTISIHYHITVLIYYYSYNIFD